ncbi:MAG TPA: hypothetical protein VHO46_09645 [Bacteroidales bacterium]|nr:hypothetical protein [Bacteroidales bacterium]
MRTRTKTFENEKNIALLVSKISENEILGINEMTNIRGGDDPGMPPTPPVLPKL